MNKHSQELPVLPMCDFRWDGWSTEGRIEGSLELEGGYIGVVVQSRVKVGVLGCAVSFLASEGE